MFSRQNEVESAKLEGERINLKKGDILAYHGNLSYYINCSKPVNSLYFLHLIEARGLKWEYDNLYYYHNL